MCIVRLKWIPVKTLLDRNKRPCCNSLDHTPFLCYWQRCTLLMNLCRNTLRFLFRPGRRSLAFDEDAFPGFEERIVYDSGDSQVEELQEATFNVASAGYETTDSDGYRKRLQYDRHMYQTYGKDNIVDGDDDDRHQHKRNHHQRIKRHRHTECYRFIYIKYRRSQCHLAKRA